MSALPKQVLAENERIAEIAAIDNKFDAYAFLRRYVRDCGYRTFTLLDLAAGATARASDLIIMSSLPEVLLSEVEAARIVATSPAVADLRRSVVPLAWDLSIVQRRQEGDRKAVLELFERHGVTGGICLPVHNHEGRRAVIIFMGDRQPPAADEIARMLLVSSCFFDRLSQLEPATGARTVRLSERERQCLVWTAAGKTSSEIATILGLSEHTINQYIGSSSQKLGAVNRTHAVAQALRLKLID